MKRPSAKVEKVNFYPKPVDLRKSINGFAALAESWISRSPYSTLCFSFSLKGPETASGFCIGNATA
jgi:hypothetical protein